MQWTLYLRLIVLTAGTLLPFFWMVAILGHRRQRNFERLFFFLCLALTCFFGSSLLALNAELHYGAPPAALLTFAWTFLSWVVVCAFADSPLAPRIRQCERFAVPWFRKIFVDRGRVFAGDPADG